MKLNRLRISAIVEIICLIMLLIYMFSTKGDVSTIISAVCLGTIAILERQTAEGIMTRNHQSFDAAQAMIADIIAKREALEKEIKLKQESNDTIPKA